MFKDAVVKDCAADAADAADAAEKAKRAASDARRAALYAAGAAAGSAALLAAVEAIPVEDFTSEKLEDVMASLLVQCQAFEEGQGDDDDATSWKRSSHYVAYLRAEAKRRLDEADTLEQQLNEERSGEQ
jgi:hypothetical protein